MKSVVIRGSICTNNHPTNYVQEVIDSIRTWFSDEIIISTWNDQEKYTDNLHGHDKLILTNDPGSGPIQHIKRQIISFNNGVLNCSGDEIMVIRSDVKIEKNPFNFLNLYDKKIDTRFNVFDHKIIIFNMMSIIPESFECPNTFRLSDWLHVGYRNDILTFGNVLQTLNDINDKEALYQFNSSNTCTEKLWIMLILKNKLKELNVFDTKSIDKYSWEFIINNFIILNTKTTLKAENLNWKFQPQDLHCYITEELYNQKYFMMT